MDFPKARQVFINIESDEYTEQEKLQAIHTITDDFHYNSITKEQILRAFKWFFEYCCEVEV